MKHVVFTFTGGEDAFDGPISLFLDGPSVFPCQGTRSSTWKHLGAAAGGSKRLQLFLLQM